MKKLFILLIACLSLAVQGHAQALDVLPQVFSPNAAELGKYGKIPVSYFNGLPNISIPLTELKAKDYTLPIYLTYHAGGNKPDQHPGWVGLGWTLHAGGCINRIVKGTKDELTNYEAKELLLPFAMNVNLFNPELDDPFTYVFDQSNNHIGNIYHARQTQKTDWDNAAVLDSLSQLFYFKEHEPDEFQVCLDGINASFYITGENEIKIVSDTDADFSVEWKLANINNYTVHHEIFPARFNGHYNIAVESRVFTYISEIKLTNHDGVKYIFGRDETAIEFYTEAFGEIAVSTPNTWLLSSIETPSGETITFHYEKEIGGNLVKRDIHTKWSYKELFPTATIPYEYDSDLAMNDGVRYSVSFSMLQPSYLASIACTVSGDSVSFTRTRSLEAEYDYTEKELQRRFIDFGGVPFSTIRDADHYCQLASIAHNEKMISFEYTQSDSTRLHLLSVDSSDVTTTNQGGRYSFQYNEQVAFPGYNSKRTDKWNYFNDIYYGSTPFVSMESVRQPDSEKMQLEILTRLDYPTGGYTLFEYEPHSYSKVMRQFPFDLEPVVSPIDSIAGGLRIKTITDVANTGLSETREFSYEGEDGRSSGILSGYPKFHSNGEGYGTYYYDPNSLAAETWHYHETELHGTYIMNSELPLASLSTTNGNHVTYTQVTESVQGENKTVFRYLNHDGEFAQDVSPREYHNFNNLLLVAPFNSRSLFRGHLLSKSVYDRTDRKIKEEEYTYHLDSLPAISSAAISEACGGWLERVSYVRIYSDFPYLEHSKVTTYPDEGGDPLVEETDYEYNDHRQLIKTTRRIGSRVEETRTLYSGDTSLVNRSPYSGMQAAGIFDRPVEQTVLRDGKVVSSSLITYRQLGDDMFVPGKYFEARLNSPIPSSSWHPYNGSFSSEQESIYGAARLSFDSYDSHANILAATAEGGLHSLYSWDPSGMNPEASFTGMLTPVRNVIVEATASQSVNFDKNHVEEYTFEFNANRTGEFSFYMSWPDCIAYDMIGTLDGTVVFDYEAPKRKGKSRDPITMPPVDGPILTPITEMYSGTVTAGRHSFKIVRNSEPQQVDPHTIVFNSYLRGSGWIDYPVYRTEQRSDELGAWYFDFEKDGNYDVGFHSGTSWKGLKTFSKSIPSGIPYTIDWMECGSDGQWTYKTREFTGRATIGGSAVSIDNVRIYPADAAVNSWTWTNANDLSSVTDGRGITEQYEYDGLGRLITVRDSDGNKKASYAYHYASTGSETLDNYVKTSQYTNESGITARETIQYHDGLGRPWQTLSLNAGKDEDNNVRHLAEQTDYDAAGRPFRTWLPFRTASLLPQSSTPSESLYSDSEPFSLVEYDGSPLDRPRLEYGPGANWHSNGKAVSHGYYTNGTSTTLNCKRFTLAWSGDTTVVVSNNGNIPSATLSVESLTDEDGLTLLTFKNMYGQPLLERRHPQFGIDFDTYYIYDNLGRLSAVLPPAIANKSVISSTDIDKYAYLYRYDSRGNCIAKKLPGCGWSFMVYDARGAMIMSQDAVQRNNGKWTLLLADGQGRQCLTGVCTASLDAFGDPYGNATIYVRKTGNPGNSGDVHASSDRNFYGYTLYTMTPRNLTVNQATLWSPYGPAESYDRVLGPTTSAQVLKTTYTYDAKGRVMKTERQTHLGGTETEQVTYSFTDEVLSRALVHTNAAGQSQLEQYTYTYDHWGRPLKTTHRYGTGNETVLHNNAYDGLGRLSSDSRNGAPALYTSYTNNVRSWLTSILCGGGSTFSEALYYESPISRGTPRWAGNVSQMAWKSGTDPTTHRYSFTYDNFGRLTSAAYDGGARGGNYGTSYIYDANSNLISISRAAIEGPKGAYSLMPGGTVYYLSGNQVMAREQNIFGSRPSIDASGARVPQMVYYDACGRMARDDDRGVSKILYNDLYLPSEIRYAAPESGQEPESYGVQYAADGRKLRTGRIVSAMKQFNNVNVFEDIQEWGEQEFSRADTLHFINPGSKISIGLEPAVRYESPTDYVGNLVYKDGVLEKILVDGGYITAADMNYHFFVTDHLGNVRVVVNSAGTVEQVNQYYPYGETAEMGMPVQPTTDNPYKWGGKEWDEDQGAYDFGARMYSAADARWTTMDPLSEKYYHISPYAYCAGDPVNLVDPEGMNSYRVDENGKITYVDDEGGDEYDYLYSTNAEGEANKKNGVKITDTSILRTLLDKQNKKEEKEKKGKKPDNNGAISATSTNVTAVMKAFKFMADNTNVEWAVHFGELDITVGTVHDEGTAGNWSWYGLSEMPQQSIHSHPDTTRDKERGSMSADYDHVNHGITAQHYYVYFPDTKAVWQLLPGITYRWDNNAFYGIQKQMAQRFFNQRRK